MTGTEKDIIVKAKENNQYSGKRKVLKWDLIIKTKTFFLTWYGDIIYQSPVRIAIFPEKNSSVYKL